MNNHIFRRSTVYGAQESSGVARLRQRGERWRSTKLQRALFVLLVIASTLVLIGCSGGDDDDNSEDISGDRTQDFRNVMPIVNGKSIVFPNGVMGATGPTTTLSVSGITTCTDATNCRGTFVLDGENADGEGDSGGETSCFFDFPTGAADPLDRPRILCGTCDIEIVGDCVVEAGTNTVCQVRWLLAGAPDDPNPVTSTPFDVTFTLNDAGDVVADGVVLIDEEG